MALPAPSALRTAVAGMIALAVAMGIGRFVFTPILPGMMQELGLSASDAGLIAAANYLGYLVGALVAAGRWAAGKERTMAAAALLASAVLCAAMGLTTRLDLFVVVRFFAGLASAFVMIFSAAIVLDRLAEAGRNDLQALHFGGVGLGIALSSILIAMLVLDDAAWPAGWLAAAGLSLVGGLMAILLMVGRRQTGSIAIPEGRLEWSGALLRLILAYGLFGFGYIVTATFLVAIVRQDGGGRLFEAAVWLVAGLAGFPSVALGNGLVPRLGLATIFALGCFLEAAGVVASVSLGRIAGPLVGAVLLGGTFIVITAFGLKAGRLLAPSAPRRALSVMTAAFGIGQVIGPLAAGALADRSGGFFWPSLMAAAALVASGAIVRALRRVAALT